MLCYTCSHFSKCINDSVVFSRAKVPPKTSKLSICDVKIIFSINLTSLKYLIVLLNPFMAEQKTEFNYYSQALNSEKKRTLSGWEKKHEDSSNDGHIQKWKTSCANGIDRRNDGPFCKLQHFITLKTLRVLVVCCHAVPRSESCIGLDFLLWCVEFGNPDDEKKNHLNSIISNDCRRYATGGSNSDSFT